MNMLKQLGFQAAILGCCLSVQAKIGVVDEAKVDDQFYKKQPAEEKFQMITNQFQAEHDKMITEGDKLLEERKVLVEKLKAPGVAESAKKGLEKQITELDKKLDEKANAIKAFRQEKTMMLQEQRQQILQEHFAEIKVAIEQVAKEKGCEIVFGAAAIAYADKSLDLTDAVIQAANKGQSVSKEAPKSQTKQQTAKSKK